MAGRNAFPMSTLANIPVRVRAEVKKFVDEIGERRTYERMLEHIPVHFAGVRSIDITLELPHNDFDRGPRIDSRTPCRKVGKRGFGGLAQQVGEAPEAPSPGHAADRGAHNVTGVPRCDT